MIFEENPNIFPIYPIFYRLKHGYRYGDKTPSRAKAPPLSSHEDRCSCVPKEDSLRIL